MRNRPISMSQYNQTLERAVDLHPGPLAVCSPTVLVVELSKGMLVFYTAIAVIGSSAFSEVH